MILGEDQHRLYLWKPAGLPVFPPHADPAGDCLLRRLLDRLPERAAGWPPGFEGGIAHRLDNATSGLVLAARAPDDLEPLRALFRAGALRKRYWLRSHARPPFTRVVLTDPIAHHPNRRDRMVVRRGPRTAHRGRWYPAWTAFTHLGGAWWEAEIRTGVTHQVRVHARHAGLPLDGDPLYGDAPGADGSLPFCLHHLQVVAPGWASPLAPLPAGWDDAPALR